MTHPLLTPRFEVIGPYPNSAHAVGDIIEIKEGGTAEIIITGADDSCFSFNSVRFEYFPIASFRRFSNLFRELRWFELRTPEEMPEFLKDKRSYIIYKHPQYAVRDGKLSGRVWAGKQLLNIKYYLPATEEEYTEYINSKKAYSNDPDSNVALINSKKKDK